MSGHASRCGAVGPPGNRALNQARTAGWNLSSTGSSDAITVGRPGASIVIGPSHQVAVTVLVDQRQYPGDLFATCFDHFRRCAEVPIVDVRTLFPAEDDY